MNDFLKFVSTIFDVQESDVTEDTAFGEFEKWDSLMHLRLVMEIEEHYNVEIPLDEIPEIKTLKDFYRFVEGV